MCYFYYQSAPNEPMKEKVLHWREQTAHVHTVCHGGETEDSVRRSKITTIAMEWSIGSLQTSSTRKQSQQCLALHECDGEVKEL